jgi:hypothetical protein
MDSTIYLNVDWLVCFDVVQNPPQSCVDVLEGDGFFVLVPACCLVALIYEFLCE